MTPLWVNPDGCESYPLLSSYPPSIYCLVLATVPLSFVFNPDTGVIYATGSPALFLENNPTWLPFVRARLVDNFRR